MAWRYSITSSVTDTAFGSFMSTVKTLSFRKDTSPYYPSLPLNLWSDKVLQAAGFTPDWDCFAKLSLNHCPSGRLLQPHQRNNRQCARILALLKRRRVPLISIDITEQTKLCMNTLCFFTRRHSYKTIDRYFCLPFDIRERYCTVTFDKKVLQFFDITVQSPCSFETRVIFSSRWKEAIFYFYLPINIMLLNYF